LTAQVIGERIVRSRRITGDFIGDKNIRGHGVVSNHVISDEI
jgi:hypothetical protein